MHGVEVELDVDPGSVLDAASYPGGVHTLMRRQSSDIAVPACASEPRYTTEP